MTSMLGHEGRQAPHHPRHHGSPLLPATTLRRLVDLACRAPSVHNTQPWTWRVTGERLELYADWTRRLEFADPSGRELVTSCGAALHHLQVAARAYGWAADVARVADADDPTLLAVVTFSPAQPPATAEADVQGILARCTDRRRFTSWPVPGDRLRQLAATAEQYGGGATAVTDPSDRFRVEMLVSRAHHLQERDVAIVAEAERWTDHDQNDGVPSAHVPWHHRLPSSHRSRFPTGCLDDGDDELVGGDGVILLHDVEDSPAAWLRAGEGLSALWLRAHSEGLSVVPVSQVVEVPETMASLRHDVLGGSAVPLLLVRVGWQAISRSNLSPTPRRPVDEVLQP